MIHNNDLDDNNTIEAINAIIDRFSHFGLKMRLSSYSSNNWNYYIIDPNGKTGFINFHYDSVSYCLNIEDFNNEVSVSYTDLDVDILVGLFLCKVYHS